MVPGRMAGSEDSGPQNSRQQQAWYHLTIVHKKPGILRLVFGLPNGNVVYLISKSQYKYCIASQNCLGKINKHPYEFTPSPLGFKITTFTWVRVASIGSWPSGMIKWRGLSIIHLPPPLKPPLQVLGIRRIFQFYFHGIWGNKKMLMINIFL
jgi:hypothetical protein